MSVIEAERLTKHYRLRSGGGGRVVHAVDDVSFTLEEGTTLAIVGESGCGKSTIARMLVRLTEPTEGRVLVHGRNHADRRAVQLVSQNPWSALNRRKSIRHALEQPLAVHGLYPRGAARAARVRELLELVGLGEEYLGRRPGGVSGGELQRVTVARALAVEPRALVLDEPTASLDVSVKALLVNLLLDLRRRLGLGYVLITHEIDIARHLADRVAVMYLGRFVETGDAEQVFADPRHPYTRALLAAVPGLDHRRPDAPAGEVPSAVAPPPGCRFHTRCPLALDLCRRAEPALDPGPDGRRVACHRRDELTTTPC
ncbi:ABC transporter ATP-binding protein [Sphaerisporangium siamense]|uniref:Oligopeptide/dipeptide ABC transporter ATP-binding protein n=1 Tax=Sphaerisporangium siamense TaxID=795645 RepID=A0A7W7DCW2_9ACTN|nr:oligopeptide/dipeptide ABC transporter ATP-binding protein [Sphaerisporangium siamense]MBB4704487.1 oligopeptide/dipeptide ABC transporter ATP-binding protein [Sphaerisporangium siamense]GII86097.1 ABC transporter ATP-binding protein [Sphaerisporangium siamense]